MWLKVVQGSRCRLTHCCFIIAALYLSEVIINVVIKCPFIIFDTEAGDSTAKTHWDVTVSVGLSPFPVFL